MYNLHAFEKQIVEAEEMGIDVYEESLKSDMSGFYVDGIIVIERGLSCAEKNCVMAEEIGHALYTVGDITDQRYILNRRHECRARRYGYEKLACLEKLLTAYKYGCSSRYEASEYLDITEKFFIEVANYFYSRFGTHVHYKGYLFCFSPNSVYIVSEDSWETA